MRDPLGPNDVVFSNDGTTMDVVDYGEVFIDYSKASLFYTTPKSGVIWTITRTVGELGFCGRALGLRLQRPLGCHG